MKNEISLSPTHKVILYSDAKATRQRFGITAATGAVLWHGIFFDDDPNFSYGSRSEQSACELAAARKAIWLANKIKAVANLVSLRLELRVDAIWLCTLSGKAAILKADARYFGIDLKVEWIPGSENPADRWTTAKGFTKWDSADLASLPEPYAADDETEATEAAEDAVAAPEPTLPVLSEAESAARALALREKEMSEKMALARENLARNEVRFAGGQRFGCDKKISTRNQWEGCVGQLNRDRAAVGLPALTTDEARAIWPEPEEMAHA
jgi:hypothetical protein